MYKQFLCLRVFQQLVSNLPEISTSPGVQQVCTISTKLRNSSELRILTRSTNLQIFYQCMSDFDEAPKPDRSATSHTNLRFFGPAANSGTISTKFWRQAELRNPTRIAFYELRFRGSTPNACPILTKLPSFSEL